MPNHKNRGITLGSRLARQRNGTNQCDPKRMELLEKILEESSSVALNDLSKQTNPKKALEMHSNLLDMLDELRQIEANLNQRSPIRNENTWTKFFDWIDDRLAEFDSDSNLRTNAKMSSMIGVKKVDDIGGDDEYCLIAKTPFKKGDSVFGIDRKIVLSTETVTRDIDLYDFIRKDTIASSMQNVVLVLHLLNEFSKGDRSNWFDYMSILPNKVLPILTMTKTEIEKLKSSSYLIEALKMIRAIARQYTYFYKRLELTNLPLKRDFTFNYYIWGVSIVCSRQNEIPPTGRTKSSQQQLLVGGQAVHALVPILDMCNHDPNSEQAIFESNQTKLVAHKDLNIGDEITLNYGSRTSGEFYIHNGFVPNKVPNDSLPLTIALNDSDKLYHTKVNLLKTFNMLSFGRFRLMTNAFENRHRRDPHLTMFLIVYFLNEDELDFIESSDNPVGVADEIYEYVQYNKYSILNQDNIKQPQQTDQTLARMKIRLEKCVEEYLSKRGSIGVVLLKQSLEGQKCQDDIHTSRLLKHEQMIFESYIDKKNEML